MSSVKLETNTLQVCDETNNFLDLMKIDEIPTKEFISFLYKKLIPHTWKDRLSVAVVVSGTVLCNYLKVCLPGLTGEIVTKFISVSNYQESYQVLFPLFGKISAYALTAEILEKLVALTQYCFCREKVVELGIEAIKSVQEAEISNLAGIRPAELNDICSDYNRSLGKLSELMYLKYVSIASNFVFSINKAVSIADTRLGLLLICTTVCGPIFEIVTHLRFIKRKREIINVKETEWFAAVSRVFDNVSSIARWNTEEYERENVREKNLIYIQKFKEFLKAVISFEIISEFMVSIEYIVMILGSLYIARSSTNFVPNIIELTGYQHTLHLSFQKLVRSYKSAMVSIHKMKAIKCILDLPKRKEGVIEDFKKGLIEFSNVSYKYSENSEKYILKSVNIVIPLNSSVLIKGPCGSGKTTIAKLLTNIHSCTDGEITIGGLNILHYKITTLRDKVLFLQFDDQLYVESVRYNINYSLDRKLSDEEILARMEEYDLTEFLANFKDLDLIIGRGSIIPSKGQQKALVLLRASFRKSEVFIIDEPFSDLDPKSYDIFINMIKSITAGKQLIVIDHTSIEEKFKFNRIYEINNTVVKIRDTSFK